MPSGTRRNFCTHRARGAPRPEWTGQARAAFPAQRSLPGGRAARPWESRLRSPLLSLPAAASWYAIFSSQGGQLHAPPPLSQLTASRLGALEATLSAHSGTARRSIRLRRRPQKAASSSAELIG